MKKLFLFALIAAATLSGCKKDDDDKPANNGDVTISGVKTSFTQMKFYITTVGTDKKYDISNYGTEDNDIYLNLTNPKVGDNNFSDKISVDVEIGSKSYDSKNSAGKVNITTLNDKTVSGTFSGTFVDWDTDAEVQISGSFNSNQISVADLDLD